MSIVSHDKFYWLDEMDSVTISSSSMLLRFAISSQRFKNICVGCAWISEDRTHCAHEPKAISSTPNRRIIMYRE